MSDASGVMPAFRGRVGSPGRPWIRTTYQLQAAIPSSAAIHAARMDEAQKCVLHWVKDKLPNPLPQDAWDGKSFRLEWPGQKVEAVSVPELGLWSFRYEHPDMPFGDRPAVPGRTWTVDVAFACSDSAIDVGVRVYCASLPYAEGKVAMTRPRLVVELANRVGLEDIRRLHAEPWALQSNEDLDKFELMVCSPNRKLPVVVLTQPDRQRLDVEVGPYVLKPDEVARRLLGLAHVVTLPWELGYQWTDRVGKPWSAYLGAVRTYMPWLDLDEDPPSMHPLTYAEKILFWRNPGDDRIGEAPFTDFLVGRLFEQAAAGRVDWGALAFVPAARTKAAELARNQATEADQWRPLYEEEIAALKTKVDELEKEAEEYSDDAMRAGRERDQFADENRSLRFELDSLRQALAQKTGSAEPEEIPIPNSYEEMADWANRYLVGRVVLHPRALRRIKDARYEDPSLVYKSLLLLANEYREQRLGYDGAKERFDAKLADLGLRFGGSISETRAGEEGDQYYVRFPTASSPKRFLEWHLRKGVTKDDRLCMGIYLFWDEDTNQVVVGWLPSHLDNRQT